MNLQASVSATQNAVLRLDWQYQHHLVDCPKCKFISPTADLLSQNLWAGVWESVFQWALQVIFVHDQV